MPVINNNIGLGFYNLWKFSSYLFYHHYNTLREIKFIMVKVFLNTVGKQTTIQFYIFWLYIPFLNYLVIALKIIEVVWVVVSKASFRITLSRWFYCAAEEENTHPDLSIQMNHMGNFCKRLSISGSEVGFKICIH